MRFNSVIIMRIHVARSGISMLKRFSTASEKASSVNSGEA